VGTWVGNADYSPMENTTGVTGAGPIWAEFMTFAINRLTGGNPTPFTIPGGIEQHTICIVSGTQPSKWCPSQREEYFAADQPPLPPDDDLWRQVQYDTWTGLLASDECTSDYIDDRLAINVTEQWARNWILQNESGQQWARDMGFKHVFFVPDRKCSASDPRPHLEFVALQDGQTITQSSLDISVVANATAGFRSWRLDWSSIADPENWKTLLSDFNIPVELPAKVYTWDLSGMPDGQIILRLYMQGDGDSFADKHISLNLLLPTPTPMPTSTSTPSPTVTPIPTPTNTPTAMPTPTNTPTEMPVPTDTPSEIPTPTDTPIP
jgi:hypothetical protein